MPTTTITKAQEGERARAPVGKGDELVTSLRLEGPDIEAQVLDTVLDGDIELSIEGSSTLSLVLHDPGPDYVLLNSGLYVDNNPLVVTLPGDDAIQEDDLRFVLMHVDKEGDEQTLTFEDEIAYWLSQYNKPVKAARSKVTRAEFILARVNEVQEIIIPTFIPELHEKVPITSTPHRTRETTQKTKDVSRGGGFHSGSKITVKHSGANVHQRKVAETILDVCASHNAPTGVMVMAIMNATTETNMGMEFSGGNGVFQRQTRSDGLEKDCSLWLTGGTDFHGGGAIAVYKRYHGKQSLAWMCSEVQHDATWSTSRQGFRNAPWKDEAERTVRLYGGGTDSASITTRTEQKTKRYEFSRGKPGGPKGENTWGMGLRLAQEVKWRFFSAMGVLYYISEPELMSSRARALITPDTVGVEEVNFGWNVTSKKDIPPSEIIIEARADRWGVPPGAVVELDGYGDGIANGFWLISNVKRGLYDSNCTITCKQPSNPRDEPAPETVTTRKTTRSAAGGGDESQGNAPFAGYPLAKRASCGGGPRGGTHAYDGIWQDWNARDLMVASGTPVLAVTSGRITHISGQGGNANSGGRYAGFGITQEGDGNLFFYKHLRSKSVNVGDRVRQGQVIGHSGFANAAHLHFAVRDGSPDKYTHCG